MRSRAPAHLALLFASACTDPATLPVSHWVAQLRANEAAERAEAREWLVKKGRDALPEVAPLLADDDTVVAMAASDVLAMIGADAVPALVAALESGPAKARGWAAHALGRIGPPARGAIPALERAAGEPALKATAMEALWKIRGSS